MKKTNIFKITAMLSFWLSIGHTQSLTVSYSEGRIPTDTGCRGSGSCGFVTISNQYRGNMESIPNVATLFYDGKSHINIRLPKSNMDAEIKASSFENQSFYFLPEDVKLEYSVQVALEKNIEKPLILAKGYHPLIELEDCYIISYTLKQ
jgi:hypothetical protein